MRPIRWSLVLLPALFGAALAGCSVRTERTVYTPTAAAPAPVAVAPARTYYYSPSGYYYEAYRPGYYYYSSY